MADHCVTLRFPFDASDLDPVFELEEALSEAIESAEAGELDGNDVGQGECVLYMYGPNADELLRVIQPVLVTYNELLEGGHAVLRYGPAEDGAREVTVALPNT